MSRRRHKVLWLTNVPAPYRLAIWNHLSNSVELKVVFILKERNWRNWPAPITDTWDYLYLAYRSIKIGEFVLVPNFFGATKILKGIDTVIIGGWESPMFIRTTFLARRRGVRVVHFYESTLQSHRFNNPLMRKVRSTIFSAADFIVTPGDASTQAVLAMGIAPERIVTLFNPVDVSWFDTYAKSHRVPPTPGHKYLFVGRLIALKNVSSLIQAFATIRQGADTLTIAGDGELSSELREIAQTLNISDFVYFLGHKNKEELASIYATSSTLILPSTNEVWGLVVNEALACGLQVIVSDKCGVAKFVKPMQGAYVCSSSSLDIAAAMNHARSEWAGHINNPEILAYTPERFADSLLEFVVKDKMN